MSDISRHNKIVKDVMKEHSMGKSVTKDMIKGLEAQQTATEALLNQNIHKYETGAQRSADCEEFDYCLISPIALKEIALRTEQVEWGEATQQQCLNAALDLKYQFLNKPNDIKYLCYSAILILASIDKETENRDSVKQELFFHENLILKLRYDLIPYKGLKRVASRYLFGAKKYGYYNWEKGMDILSLQNHSIEHIRKYQNHINMEDDNLAAAAWGDFGSIHSFTKWPNLNLNLRKL